MIFMGEQYFKGLYAAYLGASFFSGPIYEWQIDLIKENISHYCESLIDHSQIPDLTKEGQTCQMKQNIDMYIHGVKDELKATGRLV